MPRASTKKSGQLSQHTLAQLDALAREAAQKLADDRAYLAAIQKEQKAREEAAQHVEVVRLGKLAYAAGLQGVDAGILEKAFAQVAAAVPPLETEEE